jgi:hypothetical protein
MPKFAVLCSLARRVVCIPVLKPRFGGAFYSRQFLFTARAPWRMASRRNSGETFYNPTKNSKPRSIAQMLSDSAVVRPVAPPFYSEKKSTHAKRAEENEKQDIY